MPVKASSLKKKKRKNRNMPTALEEIKRIGNEVTQLTEIIEQEQAAGNGGTTTPTQFSSSVSSVYVDPTTGVVKIIMELTPGENPIVPIPDAAVQAQGAPVTEAPGEDEPQPGFAPAQ